MLDETSKTDPLSIYASSKLQVEKLFKNKNVIIFRLGTLFGLSDLFSRIRMDLVVNTLCAKAFFEKKITVFGGDQFRPLLHVKDVARATVFALKSKKKGIYNLAYNKLDKISLRYTTWASYGDYDKEMFEKMSELYDRNINLPVKHINVRKLFAQKVLNSDNPKQAPKNPKDALIELGYEFSGFNHRGIDDAKNISHLLNLLNKL